MGNEAICRIEIGAGAAETKVLLETDEIVVRGSLRAKMAFRDIRDVNAINGVLHLTWNGEPVRVHVGKDAEKWAAKIRSPKSVADKLGIKPGQRITVLGTIDTSVLGSVELSKRLRRDTEVVFLAANSRAELERLGEIRETLAPAGVVWVIRPKGITAITEGDVLAAAKDAGLVDVKVVRFSDTHTAEKLVIPISKR